MINESGRSRSTHRAGFRVQWNHWITLVAALSLLAGCAAKRHGDETAPLTSSGSSDVVARAPGDVAAPPAGAAAGGPGSFLSDRDFYIRSLGTRCLDFGAQASWAAGGPVIIYTCNGTVAQQVRVKEIDESHDVELRVQSSFCIGVRGGQVVPGRPLELQVCDNSPAQRFALDGDAILMGAQNSGRVTRQYVIEPEQDRTASRTPLVVGTREVSEAEYFRFHAVDGSAARPTTGFVTVSTETWLDWALSLKWGTVIEIDDRQPLMLTDPKSRNIPAGVTLRGFRKHTYQGPEILRCTTSNEPAFVITNDSVRMTGFRFRGPLSDPRCPISPPRDAHAIRIAPRAVTLPDVSAEPPEGVLAREVRKMPHVLIDHLDISYWNGHALDVRGPDDKPAGEDDNPAEDCPSPPLEYPRKTPVQAVGNFIHHDEGYGVVAGHGAFVLVQGNIFYRQHAHSIASDPMRTSGYHAYDNFILSQTRSHDVDMHGSLHGQDSPQWWDGVSGDYFDVGWNTFLPTGHHNINQRGTPCRFTAIHNNIFLQSEDDAIKTITKDMDKHVTWDNSYGAVDPAGDLAVGDFDGDGIDDVFVGTGSGWYYSSGGQAEWRFLNRMPEHASGLRFGDFDGDGRTDVLALHGADIDVSWGGVSPWQAINVTAWKLEDLAVGDFDGDRRADLFLATGSDWFYAPGGRNWIPFAQSSYRTPSLRFGDFTKDSKTDVLGVVGGQWQIVSGGTSTWAPLRPALTNTLDGLVVADFNGDGFADVARTSSGWWQFSSRGLDNWSNLRSSSRQIADQPIGRFDGNTTADVILWDDGAGRHFDYAPSGDDPVGRLSRQDMR